MGLRFTKMQALGNDYVYIDAISQTISEPNKLAWLLSNRNFGIGSDGMVLVCPSEVADFRMRMFNPDGTEAEICGNAIRSVAKFVYHHRLTRKKCVLIETLAGVKTLELTVKGGEVVMITANMGPPVLEAKRIPVISDGIMFVDKPVEVLGRTFFSTAVGMGNPHVVSFIDEDVSSFDLARYGAAMEVHPIFPKKVNAEFAQVIDKRTLNMRVWERGTGETLACGTGCCVSMVGGALTDRCGRSVDVRQKGGIIHVEWAQSGDLFMTGPSDVVFEGDLDEGYLMRALGGSEAEKANEVSTVA